MSCGTLVYLEEMPPEQLLVENDDTDFYGKNYWLERQKDEFGTGDIFARARNDLTERNLHWLQTLLKYSQPPGRVLELGCSHGSFVALMRQTGFDACGVEMSPWVVNYAQETFGVPVSVGPLENLDVPSESFDVIAAMDVLEHLPDPVATLKRCVELLKPDGVLLIQTPQHNEGADFEEMVATKARFLEMLIPKEHIYLFSRNSATRFFTELGAPYIEFEPALFAHYDMFFAVSKSPLRTYCPDSVEKTLGATPHGRIALAMLDLRRRELASDADRIARGEQIDTLTKMVHESEAHRAELNRQVNDLNSITAHSLQIVSILLGDLRALFSHRSFRWLARTMHWREVEDLENRIKNP